jgi:hypothetical protein
MATEIVRWCDLHLARDTRVDAHPHALGVDGKEWDLDLCDECYKEHLGPILDVARKSEGQPPAGSRKPRAAKQHRVDDRECLLGDYSINGTSGALRAHVKVAHGTTLEGLFGVTCPVCGHHTASLSGLGTHGHHLHQATSVSDLFRQAIAAGDPHGIVAARRAVA